MALRELARSAEENMITKILYAGDIHGSSDAAEHIDTKAEENNVNAVIQVGDFAMHWFGYSEKEKDNLYQYFLNRTSKIPWYTCGGNHENWSTWNQLASQTNSSMVELAPNCFYIKRGHVATIVGIQHLFIGGAQSTDRLWRIPYHSWWPEEQANPAEWYLALQNLNHYSPKVVVSHDAPLNIHYDREGREKSLTPNELQYLYDNTLIKPELWVYGHHHVIQHNIIENTNFYCCGVAGQNIIVDHELPDPI